MHSLFLAVFAALCSVAVGQLVSQQTCSADRRTVDIGPTNPDVLIGGLFPMRNSGSGQYGCGTPKTDVMQAFEAARYTIDFLNQGQGFVPGITFGMKAYDTCCSASHAVQGLTQLYPQSRSSNPYCSQTNAKVTAGVMGPLMDSTALSVAEVAGSMPASVISSRSENPALSNSMKFPTFLRTSPSSAVLANAMVALLKQLQWENFLVVYVDNAYGTSTYHELLKAAFTSGLCVSQAIKMKKHATVQDYSTALNGLGAAQFTAAVFLGSNSRARKLVEGNPWLAQANLQWIFSDLESSRPLSPVSGAGLLSLQARSVDVSEFENYFTNLLVSPQQNNGNPWFEQWYEAWYSCSLTGANRCPTQTLQTLRSQFAQSPTVVPTMKAIFAYAETVRSVCQGQVGVCSTLTSMSPTEFNRRLRALDYTFTPTFGISGLRGQRIRFDENGDVVAPAYTVMSWGQQNRGTAIGRYEGGTLTLDQIPQFFGSSRTTALSPNPTATCASVGCDTCLRPPTSVTFRYQPANVVIASLVSAHQPGQWAFTCGQADPERLLALVAAEWAVVRFKTRNPNKLKGVTLGSLVADVCPDSFVSESFLSDLLSGNNRLVDAAGRLVSDSTIKAFVDLTGSSQGQRIHKILSSYHLPEIQVGTSTSELSGMTSPYFSRALPSEKAYYTAVASMLQKLGWLHVQVVSPNNEMYTRKVHLFRKIAATYGVCITKVVDTNVNPSQLASSGMGSVVVVIATVADLQNLLKEMTTQSVTGLQIVSAVEAWTRDLGLLTSVGSAANDLIVLEPQLGPDADFSAYLSGLSVADISVQPFLRDLYETTNQCYLVPETKAMYQRACTASDSLNVYQGKTPYVIQSVYLVAEKLHKIIADVCGDPNYNGLCPQFHSSSDIARKLQDEIRNSGSAVPGFEIRDGEGVTDFIISVYKTGQSQYVQMGTFDSATYKLESLNQGQLTNPSGHSMTCQGSCVQCQYLYALQNNYRVPGDWMVVGSFSVSESGPKAYQPYICGDTRLTYGPSYSTAMTYALQQINSSHPPVSVKGIQMGGLILDHCNNEGRAELLVSDIFSGMFTDLNPSRILSWLSDNTASTKAAAELLDPLGVAMVSPSATSASLMDDHSIFFRTIQGDTTSATALMKIVKSLGFAYVQAVHTAGRSGLSTVKSAAEGEGICITSVVEMDITKVTDVVNSLVASDTKVVVFMLNTADTTALVQAISQHTQARQELLILMLDPHPLVVEQYGPSLTFPILSLELQTSALAGYKAYMEKGPIDNPFFAKYYMKLFNCNLPGHSMYPVSCTMPLSPVTANANYIQDQYVLSTINAVYASVDALDRTIKEFCGDNYTHPCSTFLQASNWRERYNFMLNRASFIDESSTIFRFVSREGNVGYNILQAETVSGKGVYKRVGSYQGISLGQLTLSAGTENLYSTVVAECPPPCLGCVARGLNFSLTPGDIYLAGMFDVHKRSTSPFTCGGINSLHGYLLLEAFHFALSQVNDKKGQFANILHGTRLGGVGLDGCGSRIRMGNIISNINNGLTSLVKDGITVTPGEIDAYIGTYESSSSLYTARLLTDLEIPQISYASTSNALSDQYRYPYFYRTVPSDENIVKAMLSFLNKNDIRYVQILYEDNSNAYSSKEAFVKLAADYDICVSQAVLYPETGRPTDEVSNDVVAKLVEVPAANTVVTFLNTPFINSVLKAIGRSDRARGKLRFFGDLSWADNQDAIEAAEENAVGSLTIKQDNYDIDAFESYIDALSQATSETPWFEEYYQNIHQCYNFKTNTMGYPRACPRSTLSIINSNNYQQDPDVLFVMDAVYAAAFAIHKSLQKYCGPNYTTVCQAYTSNANRRLTVAQELETVTFTDPVGHLFQFDNRQANSDFKFYDIEKGTFGGANYMLVGSYNYSNGQVSMVPNYQSAWRSGCDRADACAECPAIRDSGTRYFIYDSKPPGQRVIPDDATTIVAFFDIHHQGVDPYRCGPLNMEGFQHFVAFLYSAQVLFKTKIDGTADSRGLRLIAIDTCGNSLRIDQDLFGLLQGNGLCNTVFDTHGITISLGNLGSVLAVGDANTRAVGRLLEGPGVTYISPQAPNPVLDQNQYLARSNAPLSAKMAALSRVLKACLAVDLLYENSGVGFMRFQAFAKLASRHSIPMGQVTSLEIDGTDADYDVAVNSLSYPSAGQVVMVAGSQAFVRRVMSSATGLGRADDYMWVFVTDQPFSEAQLSTLSTSSIKVLTVSLVTDTVQNFNTYLENMADNVNALNIPAEWYDEFYQIYHDCRLSTAAKVINKDKPECIVTSPLQRGRIQQNPAVINTLMAMQAITSGLNAYIQDCRGACNTGQPLNDKAARDAIRSRILAADWDLNQNLTLTNGQSLVFKFDQLTRWWDARYTVETWHVRPGQAVVREAAPLAASMETLCALRKVDNSTVSPITGGRISKDTEPRNYYKYDSTDGKKVYDWPIWAVVMGVLTTIGIVITIILFLILLCAYPHRGGTSILGYLAIFGIILIYGINFAFFIHAGETTCGLRRFFMGGVYMVVFASLLIKAIDNWRFSHAEYTADRYSGISSPCALLCCALGIIIVQCVVPIIWLILVNPTASLKFDALRNDHWWCDPTEDYDLGLVLSMSFVAFIILITAIFSALAYDSERNNYESRWILFSCIATAGCFLVWMVVTTNAEAPYRDPSVAIANFVNACMLVVILPLRKTILLFRARREKSDEKNSLDGLDGGPYNQYENSYNNQAFELNDYDNQYFDG